MISGFGRRSVSYTHLPVFVGQATRAVSFAESGQKEYVAGLKLGLVTNTQDTSGETLGTHPASVTRTELESVLPRFTGEIEQIPPMYSAIKIGGKKLYELARRGEEVERKPRPVTIYELEVVEQTAPDAFTLRIRCSKGTYVRTLCHDIGRALGCGGCMSALRRTMAAGFTLADAVTLERVQLEGESLLQPVDSLFRAQDVYKRQAAARTSAAIRSVCARRASPGRSSAPSRRRSRRKMCIRDSTRTSSFESFSSEDFTASTEPWTSALTIRFRFFISPA